MFHLSVLLNDMFHNVTFFKKYKQKIYHNFYLIISKAKIAIIKLINVPTKYFSAKSFFSNCLNLASDFAVKTNAIELYKPSAPKSNITTLSSIPISAPTLSDSTFSQISCLLKI